MILVTGASGQVGKHLLRALSARGISTRAWIHSERNEESVLTAGATEVYIGDLTFREDAATAMKDYAEAAAKIIAAGTYTYGTYKFCSEGTYSMTDMKNVFSEQTGCKVTSAFISDADFLATTHKVPYSYEGQTLLTMFRHYDENSFCGNAFTLTQILGRHPVTIRDY